MYTVGVAGKQGGEGSAHGSGFFEGHSGNQAVALRDTWPVLTGNRAFNAECVGLIGAIAAKPCVAMRTDFPAVAEWGKFVGKLKT